MVKYGKSLWGSRANSKKNVLCIVVYLGKDLSWKRKESCPCESQTLMVRAILIMCIHPHCCAFAHMWLIAVN